MRRIFPLIFFILLLWSCSTQGRTDGVAGAVPDYEEESLWYQDEIGAGTDVFYITPTCIFDWRDPNTGEVRHHYDVYSQEQKGNFDYSFRLADEIFGEVCNFYSPYYRQISLESWLEDEKTVEKRLVPAMEDIQSAFDYFLKHQNKGKPFVLAGFSQGARGVVELLRKMPDEVYKRMKAAYVIGYRLTKMDVQYPHIKMATGETDQGHIICYNSVKAPENIWKIVSGDNCFCINPVNWKTDTAPAVLYDSITVQIDAKNKVLTVGGYTGNEIHIPVLEEKVGMGNYHLSELTLYKKQLNENVKKRIGR